MEVSFILVGWGWTVEELKAGWTELEALGFDACYLGDDLFPHPQVDAAVYDPWSILPAMAVTTSRMRIGSMVSPAGRRHPGLFAKMTTTVDQLSGGRLVVGMGAGNAPEQQASLHQPYPGPSERSAQLREELAILRSLWTEPRTTFAGEHYATTDAVCEPKGARRPRPEVLVALQNRKLLAPIAGQFADRVNLLGNNDDRLRQLLDAIATHAADHDRSLDDITSGRLVQVLFTEEPVDEGHRAEVIAGRATDLGLDPAELRLFYDALLSYVGPPEGCAEALRARTAELGVEEIVLCIDTIGMIDHEHTMAGARIFAAEVLPDLRAG